MMVLSIFNSKLMYVIKSQDIKQSQDFITGKWVFTHIPTGISTRSYDFRLGWDELMLSQVIPLHFENPNYDSPAIPYGYKDRFDDLTVAEFRESTKHLLIDKSVIHTERLSWFPFASDAWTACHEGYRTYAHTKDEAVRKLCVAKPYLKHLQTHET